MKSHCLEALGGLSQSASHDSDTEEAVDREQQDRYGATRLTRHSAETMKVAIALDGASL